MKLALLVGANPRTSDGGPWIKLHQGNWKIVDAGVTSSILSIGSYISDPTTNTPFDYPSSQILVGPCHVQVMFAKRGEESHLSVFAELVNGTKS